MKVNPNKKTTPTQNEKTIQVKKALKAEEANFTERINKAYRSSSIKSKDDNVESKEIYYDKQGNKLYSKATYKNGSTHYWMNDATNNGRTHFVDLDGDGNIDKMSHRTKENPNAPDFRAIDKDDNGQFDIIKW